MKSKLTSTDAEQDLTPDELDRIAGGVVDAADYTVWRDSFGMVPPSQTAHQKPQTREHILLARQVGV